MRKPHGYAVTTTPGERDREEDSTTCCHCNGLSFVPPGGVPPGGYCTLCMDHTCERPDCNDGCAPFEKKLEAYERRAKLLAAVAGG